MDYVVKLIYTDVLKYGRIIEQLAPHIITIRTLSGTSFVHNLRNGNIYYRTMILRDRAYLSFFNGEWM